jgi:hypothetical protein
MLVKLLAKLAPEVYGERSTVEHVHSGFVWIEGSTPAAALPVPVHGDFNQDFGLATNSATRLLTENQKTKYSITRW